MCVQVCVCALCGWLMFVFSLEVNLDLCVFAVVAVVGTVMCVFSLSLSLSLSAVSCSFTLTLIHTL